MLPYSFIGAGSFVNAASALPATVILNDKPDWFFVKDLTNWGAQNTAANPIYAEWFSTMANGSFLALGQPSSTGSGVTTYASQGIASGFTFINSSSPPTFASLPVTSTINHTTWVVGMTNTGSIAVGDWVRIINPTGMLQAGGIVGQVTAVSVNSSITLGYIATAVSNGANFTADATGGSILKFYRGLFYPRKLQVMEVTQATQAKVYFAEKNDFTPGELVDFNIPSTYGMIQLSFLAKNTAGQKVVPARVLVSTNTATESSITLDLDTTGFTAFAYPTSAGSVGAASPPFCFPAGSGILPLNGSSSIPQSPPGTTLVDSFDNRNQYYMYIGSSVVGANSATMQWMAFKADYSNLSNA